MKSARHAMILDIIAKENIDTQDELAEKLRDAGYNVTQATISRDIKGLRLIKVLSQDGVYKYATVDKAESAQIDRFIRMFSESVLSITNSGNLLILKTISGSANVAAEAIDALKWNSILGTIAGDNTIFVALEENADIDAIKKDFQSMMK